MKILTLLTISCALFASLAINAAVPKISLNVPVNNSTDIQMNPNCVWQSVPSATSYWFEVSTSTTVDANTGEFTSKTRNHKFDMKTNNFWQIRAGLHPNTKYYWHVLVKIGTELGPWSDIWNFTTTSVVDKPYQVSPDDGATMVDIPVPMTFMKVPNATKYNLQITDLSTNKTIVNDQNILDNNGDPQNVIYTVTNLSALTNFSWRVRCMVNSNWGAWTDAITFTTGESLAAPTLLTPINGATSQSITPTLTYKVLNGQTYRVDFSKDKTFTSNVGTFTKSSGSVSLANLDYSITYYWRARAESDLSTGLWSETWSFTTGAPAALYFPDLMIKANGYDGNIGMDQQDISNSGTYFAVLEANSLKKAVFYITLKNAGNVAGNIDIFVAAFDNASQAKLSKWIVKFTNSTGKDLSTSVANGNAYRIEKMIPGTSQVYRLEVSPSSGVINNDAISMLVNVKALGSDGNYIPEARDSVKAVTVKTARGNK
ncbi:MAG: fibronectin type III domain-containing protein [bacterium]